MPAYVNAAGKVVVFFQYAGKFNYRYSTLGFQDAANLDDGRRVAGVVRAPDVESCGGEEGRRAGEGRDLLTVAATAAECARGPRVPRLRRAPPQDPPFMIYGAVALSAVSHPVTA